jgi:hypothetical protein
MLVSTSNASSKHPQVCTPAFDGCPVEVYVMSARRIKGFHQEAKGCSRDAQGLSKGSMYLLEHN